MDHSSADNVAKLTERVGAYGNQLAAVFHNHALAAESLPPGFEGAINVLDATVVTLNQVLNLLNSEAADIKDGVGKRHFSEVGLKYVKLLATECATTLAKVEPIVGNACLNAKDLKAKRRREKRELAKNGPVKVDIGGLKLDEKAFLDVVENTKWSLATVEIEECMERLYDLQLHLLLVFQVVTVGVMSRDLSSGKVDVKSIVAFHDRITRTAELVGIKLPKGRSRNKYSGHESSSESSSLFYSDSSDSDGSSVQSLKQSDKAQLKGPITEHIFPPTLMRGGPPPPPPANWPTGIPKAPRPTPPWTVPSCIPPSPPAEAQAGIAVNSVNPPSYSESKPVPAASSTASTLLGTVSQTSEVSSSEKSDATKASTFPEEKRKTEETPTTAETKSIPPTLEPRLFKSNTKSLRFKAKSFFRSDQSLAKEMKKVLSDADSALTAAVIQAGNLRQVPHSAFHSLEATHMRTILAQINSNDWYDTFTKMDATEHAALDRLLRPRWIKGQRYVRELVVLKVVHEKKHDWALVLRDILARSPGPYRNNSRVLLVIVREKLLDGKTLSRYLGSPPPPPPAPPRIIIPPFPPPNVVPVVRPPPGIPSPPCRTTKTSDLRYGPPAAPYPPLGATVPAHGNAATPPYSARPDPPQGTVIDSIRISDTTPLTEYDATIALTTYIEYTLRLTDALNPGVPRSWSRVTVTQESAERHLVIQRVKTFERAGGNVLQVSLRLTELQSSQVTRLMDELKANERDMRFEWCWVELSLYNGYGEITDFASNAACAIISSATMMHLIAKRMPKAQFKPLDLYNSLMRPPPPPTPAANQAPVIIDLSHSRDRSTSRSRSRSERRYHDWISDTSSISSLSSDDSSVGYVRRKLRKNKVRKLARADLGYSSDSDAYESEDEDAIKIKLELKRGDDVVQSLLNIWTPQAEAKGKGKEKAV